MDVVSEARVLADHAEYTAARADVDTLSGRGFPVEHLAIIGSELYVQEWVAGQPGQSARMARGAAQGVAVGAVIGVVFGALMALFAEADALALVLGGGLGALAGAVVTACLTHRRPGFGSWAIAAGRHRVLVSPAWADDARLLLDRKTIAASAIASSIHEEGNISMNTHTRPVSGDRA